MECSDIYEMLLSLDIPIAYDHFAEEDVSNLSPPFGVYREKRADNFNADNKTYFEAKNFEIEIVTEKKDIELEQKIKNLLNNNNIPYEMSDEIWDRDERIYHIFYEI